MLSQNHECRIAAARANVGTLEVESAVFGARSGIFLCKLDTQAVGNYLKLMAGNAADGSDMADVAGSKCQSLADGQLIGIEFADSPYLYHKAVVIRGANTAVGDMYFVATDPASRPRNNFNNEASSTRIKLIPPGLALGTP